MYVQDLTFDGKEYTIKMYEDGAEILHTYQYLMHYEGDAETDTATFDSYVRYVLTNDNTVTWDAILYGAASSSLGDYIEHSTVYVDLKYNKD